MKILPLSDIHLEMMYDGYSGLKIPDTDANLLAFLGDIGTGVDGLMWAIDECTRLDKRGIYIPGNHEYYRHDVYTLDEKMRELAEAGPVTFLNKDETIIEGIRFLGCTLWTDFKALGDTEEGIMHLLRHRINDFRLIQCQNRRTSKLPIDFDASVFTPEEALLIHSEQRAWLIERLEEPFDGKTVLLSHHGVSKHCQATKHPLDPISTAFWSDMEAELKNRIDLACYGHTHDNVDLITDAGFRLVSNQMGYRRSIHDTMECADFNFNKTIDLNNI